MGITLMESFNLSNDTSANVMANLVNRGFSFVNGFASTPAPNWQITDFTENGMARKALQQYGIMAYNQNSWYYMRIPLPTNAGGKSWYVSMRVLTKSTRGDSYNPVWNYKRDLFISGSPANVANDTICILSQGKLTISSTSFATRPEIDTAAKIIRSDLLDKWVTLEVYRANNGTVYFWVDDVFVPLPFATLAKTDDFLYVGFYNDSAQVTGGSGYNTLIADLVVVDPFTDGLKNRPGRSGRVLDIPLNADVTTQWAAPAGNLNPHYQMMADYPLNVDTNDVLNAIGVGPRETYGSAAIPAEFGQYVGAVKVDQRLENSAAATHSLSQEVDMGEGIVEYAVSSVLPGGGYKYVPQIVEKKPDGSPWTAADISAAKFGYSIKS